jgi:hypothetical protein
MPASLATGSGIEAMPKAIASGSAITPTVMPAMTSLRNAFRV